MDSCSQRQPGNDTADRLAKEAVSAEDHGFRHLIPALKKTNRDRMFEEWRKEECLTEKGKHLRKIDSGLLLRGWMHRGMRIGYESVA